MRKWTQNIKDEKLLVSHQKQLTKIGLCVKVKLKNDDIIEGKIVNESFGNDYNGKNYNNLKYYGELTIYDKHGKKITIQILDVKSITKGICL